ncbi:hypothetical protein GGR58DRAFT_502285 [Xylaria digitata]|nr:hypothetical protein GGR58DRAFT_502285 [Xylaria digitata]
MTGGTPADNGPANNTTTDDTLVLKEVGGVPGNECLTFREIVDAACVNEAADRQMTPATINGGLALRVQRSFSAGFRADLVNVQACVGFNGTHFRASDCSDPSIELVSFAGGALTTASGACASGHDDLAQITPKIEPNHSHGRHFLTREFLQRSIPRASHVRSLKARPLLPLPLRQPRQYAHASVAGGFVEKLRERVDDILSKLKIYPYVSGGDG